MGYVTLEITGKNFEPKYRQGFAMQHVLYMLAIMGYINLEITGEVPGFLSRPQILRTTMGYVTLEITGKHYVLSMLAIIGYITLEITGKVPGFLFPSAGLEVADIPNTAHLGAGQNQDMRITPAQEFANFL